MEENKNSFILWVKTHKKQLLLAGISVTVLIGIILGLKKKDAISELWTSLKMCLKADSEKTPVPLNMAPVATTVIEEVILARSYTPPQEAFGVSQHIRNLSGGRHHSAEKAAEAAELGISLLPNQTLVDSYTKCAA